MKIKFLGLDWTVREFAPIPIMGLLIVILTSFMIWDIFFKPPLIVDVVVPHTYKAISIAASETLKQS